MACLEVCGSWYDIMRSLIIGIDEAGRGALAGPLVAAAVMITKRNCFPYGDVTDSKKLTDATRRQLFSLIEQSCYVSYGVVSHLTIDRLGIQQANVLAVDRALMPLLIDDCEIHSDYVASFSKLTTTDTPVTLHVRGELEWSEIAAASIMAKVFRDNLMIELSKQHRSYDFEIHKGYGTRKHKVALKRFGVSSVHRLSFDY